LPFNFILYEQSKMGKLSDGDFIFGKYKTFDVIFMKKNGYINATKICSKLHREFYRWNTRKETKKLVKKISLKTNIKETKLIIVVNNIKAGTLKGSYVHPLLIPNIIKWASKRSEPPYNYVYTVYSDLLNAIKIGFWRNDITSLKKRYSTYYGTDIDIFAINVGDCRSVEKQCKERFKKYNICGELFEKEYYDKYKNFLLRFEQ